MIGNTLAAHASCFHPCKVVTFFLKPSEIDQYEQSEYFFQVSMVLSISKEDKKCLANIMMIFNITIFGK